MLNGLSTLWATESWSLAQAHCGFDARLFYKDEVKTISSFVIGATVLTAHPVLRTLL